MWSFGHMRSEYATDEMFNRPELSLFQLHSLACYKFDKAPQSKPIGPSSSDVGLLAT